jgi:methylglyoxal reductase
MKNQKIGTSGLEVSVISLGTWGMGGGTSWQAQDDRQSIKIIHKALDLGINLVDTAPVYGTGHSEEVVGKAIADRRSRCILSTKCTMQWRNDQGVKMYSRDGQTVYKNFSPASLRADLESSLKRLSTDYIDIYIAHRQPDDIGEVESVYNTLAAFKKEGKIREIGLSNASPEFLCEYQKFGQIALVQEKLSLLSFAAAKEYLPLCEKTGVVFQAFSALERGLLTGKIGMDYDLAPGEARNTIPWFALEKRRLVLDMLGSWADLTEKYACSLTNLVLAATMRLSSACNLLVGVRKMENLLDTVRAVGIVLDAADAARMQRDCAALVQKSAALTKP